MRKISVGLLVIFILTNWSLFYPGFFHTNDTSHTARIVAMTKALDDGHFPVRWVSYFGAGRGMALFEFYAPLPFYIGSFIYGLGVDALSSIKVLYILCSALTLIGSYLLGQQLTGKKFPALLTSATITLAPYRAVDLFVRGALAEAYGIMALPWILWATIKIIQQQRQAWWWLTLTLTLLLLSHNLTALMFIPGLIIFSFGYWLVTSRRLIVLAQWFLASIFAFGLSAFYLIPAIMEQRLTKVFNLATASFPYTDYFVFFRQLVTPLWGYGGAAPGPYNDQSSFLGYGQIFSLIVTLGLIIAYVLIRKKLNSTGKLLLLLVALLISSLFMLHGRSLWLWQHVSILPILQFPWRWLSVAIIWLGMIAGLGAMIIKNQLVRNSYCLFMTLIIVVGNVNFFKPEKYLIKPQTEYLTDPMAISHQTGPGYIDYLPVTVTDTQPINFVATTSAELNHWQVTNNRTQTKTIATHFTQPQTFTWGIADFAGWQILIDHQLVSHTINRQGLMTLSVPAGEHQLTAQFTTTRIRRWSDLLSAVSWLGYFTVTLFAIWRGLSTSWPKAIAKR